MTGRRQLAVGALVLAVVTAIAYVSTRHLRHELFPVQLGSKAPDFTAYTLDSSPREKRRSDYRGQELLIKVWATWRLPCRVDMPSIEALHTAYAEQSLRIAQRSNRWLFCRRTSIASVAE